MHSHTPRSHRPFPAIPLLSNRFGNRFGSHSGHSTSNRSGSERPRDSAVVPPPLIDVDAVSITATDTLLLPATTFRSDAGRILALCGENGSGKTTLLRTLAGSIQPTTGSVRIGGRPADERDPQFRRRVAAMIGLPPMASDLTVRDHVALVSATWEGHRGSADAQARRVLEEFGIAAFASRYPHELSSGQTQLFALALLFVRPFDVLLLDEPEQHLDPSRIDLLARAMRARRAGGVTIVAATHSSILAERTADSTITPGRHQ